MKSKNGIEPKSSRSLYLLLAILLLLLSATTVPAQQSSSKEIPHPINVVFAERDTTSLSMDIYYPDNLEEKNPAIIFVFGGSFMEGSKSASKNVDFCRSMAEKGLVAVAIDYRLGLKDVKKVGVLNTKPLRRAISIAVEDLYSATNYLIDNADKLKIDTDRIIISGSSAGAITVLHADHELTNGAENASVLPSEFRYAGVISFAGAILSYSGKPDYKKAPSPTMMFHGTADDVVPYGKIRLFNKGFFGTGILAERFKKHSYPYYSYIYNDKDHIIAVAPMKDNISEIMEFIEEYVFGSGQESREIFR